MTGPYQRDEYAAPRKTELSPGDPAPAHALRGGEKQPGTDQGLSRAEELTAGRTAAPNGVAVAHRETWHFNEGYDVALQRLNQLRADAQAQGMDSTQFLGPAMELLNGSRMKAAFRTATSRDALQFFRGAIDAQRLLRAANVAIGKSEDVVRGVKTPQRGNGITV